MNPLETITEKQFESLFEVLWGWKNCPGQSLDVATTCGSPGCPCRRAEQLGPFKEFYRATTSRYLPEFAASTEVAFRSHDDVIHLIRHLKSHPDVPREELTVDYFANRTRLTSSHEPPNPRDQHRACSIAARILTMVTCTTENQAEDFLEDGIRLPMWEAKNSLADFMRKNFPKTDHPTLNDASERRRGKQLKDSLEGRRLTKIAGLTFQPTNNLADHLRLHPNEGYVEIFHHTRALKEVLIATRGDDVGPENGEKVISTEAYLPRQLALEVIDSIQRVLFPLGSNSESLLRSLVVKQGLDPDCLRLVEPSTPYRRPEENDVPYHYFGSRLMDLAQELEDPTPRSPWQKWLERKSGARYVMLVTLAGVGVAVLLGFLSLVASIFQAWVAYQAWKNPNSM